MNKLLRSVSGLTLSVGTIEYEKDLFKKVLDEVQGASGVTEDFTRDSIIYTDVGKRVMPTGIVLTDAKTKQTVLYQLTGSVKEELHSGITQVLNLHPMITLPQVTEDILKIGAQQYLSRMGGSSVG